MAKETEGPHMAESEIDEPAPSGGSLPFINVICKNGQRLEQPEID